MALRKQSITRAKKSINVVVSVFISREEDSFVAYCPALELSSYGDTEKEAKSAFEEALQIFVQETVNQGTLERVLLKLGWFLQQVPHVDYRPPRIPEDLLKRMKSRARNVIREEIAIPY